MVRVTPQKYFKSLFIPGYDSMPQLPLNDYWIDRYKVRNRQFKDFVDQGGYQEREYWKYEFVRDGKRLTWDQAMALFRDATGRPGPKDWVAGEYPKGHDDYPVTGISWYEAAAYAEFAGKSLPTIYHWNRAAGPFLASVIVPASNFGPTGILPVGSKPDVGPWGTYDMAGNVKEWIWTEAEDGKRYVLGGAWDEPNYMFIDPDAQSPFLRAADIGFRCVKYIDPNSMNRQVFAAMPTPRRDLTKEKPVSNQIFEAYKGLYSYDKTPLDARVEPVDSKDEDWTIQKKFTYGAVRPRAGDLVSVAAQEGQAALSGRAVLPWVRRSEPAPLRCANFRFSRCHRSQRTRRSLPGLQEHLRAWRRDGVGFRRHQQ